MGRVDLQRARARLAAERREVEQALGHHRHQDDGYDAGWLEPRTLPPTSIWTSSSGWLKIFPIG